ncbi:hypothetical protein Arub01_38390 [Actinomadura rubrobrunea]|uniref:HTH tetR-type domain-containing protein n=1 Tax=Actinomadura rubrobrunea TaxID=115335 RepID=A0A9W6PX40_9ACTN|nr:helix-turn-helix domain-containing protein [Actinomadura rubrobrunea]GLW65595.1 hypothetical protein Arub01_38390 [Actinomadura rubrobrunea]
MSRAAVRLVPARGMDRGTVEAIADEAGVSPRTFHDGVRALIDGVRARPPDEPVRHSLRQAALDVPSPAAQETGALLCVPT